MYLSPWFYIVTILSVLWGGYRFLTPGRYDDICELVPEEEYYELYDFEPVMNHPVYQEMYKRVRALLERNPGQVTITVSLSGGVDSMVSAWCLYVIQKETDLIFGLNAVHINYQNRPESDMEQHFVEEWCAILGISLYVRVIDKIRRNNSDSSREWYESVTRDIRFGLYRTIGQNFEGSHFVVLGHIKDDTIENIFTNLSKGQHIFNLKKLKIVDKMYDVQIFRPFLEIFKHQIENFACSFGIPWLLNTTPTWSNRGRMRNEFIPAYARQFGHESYAQLDYVCETLKQYSKIVDKKLKNVFNNMTKTKFGTEIHVVDDDYFELPVHFWLTVLKNVLHPQGISLPTKKGVQHFVEKLRSWRSTTIQIKKEVYCYFDVKTKTIYLLNSQLLSNELGVPQNRLGKNDWKKIKALL
jgi:tRNA(Ile)-lysidine synthetase-like protein